MNAQPAGRPDRAREPRIRDMTVSDVPSVVSIEGVTFSSPWSEDSFVGLVGRDRVATRIVEGEDGQVAGYSVLWWVLDEGELANIALAPSARGRGLGGLLLDDVLRIARRRRLRRVFLEVRPSNRSARRLYASRGFRHVGTRRAYYQDPQEDALVLALDLEDSDDP